MKSIGGIVFASVAFLILTACATYNLVEADKRVRVAASFTVTPSRDWNREVDGNIQIWTIDGPVLHQLRFFSGIEDEEPLFEDLSDDGGKDPPVFGSKMTPIEIRDLFVSSMARMHRANLSTENLRPESFGNVDGFRFEYTYRDDLGVDRRGFVLATTYDELLYLIDYSASDLYYYDRYLPSVEALLNSLHTSDT